MAYKLSCAETGAKCDFEVVTEKKDELLEHVKIHAKMAHPEMKHHPSAHEIEKLIHRV